MNKRGVLYLGLLMLVTIFSNAQAKFAADNFVVRMGSNLRLQGPKQYEAEGSPYLLDEFTHGEIYANNNKAPGVLMRYNVYEDNMEFKHQGSIYMLNPDKSIERVSMGPAKFVVEEYPHKGKLKLGYLQLLDSGKVTLLSKKDINLTPAKEATPMHYEPTPAKFERSQDVYYYKIGRDALIKVESTKKIIASLPDHKEEMSKFISENKLSVRSEEELVKLFRYYNSL